MRSAILVSAAAALLLALPAAAQQPRYVEQCADRFSVQERIDGCTAAINSGRYRGKDVGWAYANRAIAWYKKKDYDRAIADLSEAIRLEPRASRYHNRGKAWHDKEDYDRAIADYTEAIRLEPSAGRYTNRGSAWLDKNERDRAIADYTEAIRLDPKYIDAYFNRALAHVSRGDRERAIADFRKALELGDPAAREELRKLGARCDLAKLHNGDTAGGAADITAAKAIQADIAEGFARYGIR